MGQKRKGLRQIQTAIVVMNWSQREDNPNEPSFLFIGTSFSGTG